MLNDCKNMMAFPRRVMRRYIIFISLVFGSFLYMYMLQDSSNVEHSPKAKLISFFRSELIRRKINLTYVVVHIDFKRTPLKLEYLERLLQTLKNYQVNGLLMEYEDMFPYEGIIANLSAKNCFTKPRLKQFLTVAKTFGLEIIPLVQTFGHMEFALKLEEFKHMREHPNFTDSICPSQNDSRILIKQMLEQVIHFHASVVPLKHIHIGCDEVYHINQCNSCVKRNVSNIQIYLEHVRAVTDIAKTISKDTTILMWEDMIRTISPINWNYNLKIPIEPVYWDYLPNVDISHIHLMKYHKTFPNIWISTAFKGADGKTTALPNAKKRFFNHYSWLTAMLNYKFGGETQVYNFKGIILTGWSRYTHASPSCELLPVSLPSLVVNLLLINEFKNGAVVAKVPERPDIFYHRYLKDKLKAALECDKIYIIMNSTDNAAVFNFDNFYLDACKFYGSVLYEIIKQYLTLTSNIVKAPKDVITYSDPYLKTIKAVWCNNISNKIIETNDRLSNNVKEYYESSFAIEYVSQKITYIKNIFYTKCKKKMFSVKFDKLKH